MTDYTPEPFYPDMWKKLAEIQGIIQSTQGKDESGFNTAVENLIQSLENVFFLSKPDGSGGADDYGCSRWERILGINAPSDATLEDRRYNIWVATMDRRPFTLNNLYLLLDELVGGRNNYTIECDQTTKQFTIRLHAYSDYMQQTVTGYLNDIIPMNMIFEVLEYFNRYSELSSKTYAQLSAFTYEQLKTDRKAPGV